MKIASINLNIVDSEPRINFDNIKKIVQNLDKTLDFILLPELWTSGYIQEDWIKIAPRNIIVLDKMKNLAKEISIGFGFSMLWIDENSNKMSNRFFAIDKNGIELPFYDKVHLFTPMKENIYLNSGKNINIFNISEFTASATICYDLRFPEQYRKLALMGVNLFLVSAEWPKPRCETLLTLAKARAIENQAFLVLSNRIGKDKNGVEYCGSSTIIYPDGTAIFSENENGIIINNINMNDIIKAKKFINPLLERVSGVDF
jgi:predicted amidohydrolase